MKELIRVRVQYALRQQCCKTHKRPLPLPLSDCLQQSFLEHKRSRRGILSAEEDQGTDLSDDKTKQIVYEFHDTSTGGHTGWNKTCETVRSQYSWCCVKQDIEDYFSL